MPQSLGKIYLHIVFSTKYRQPLLADRALRQELFAYMVGICRNLGCPSLIINGVEDHVHLLTRHSRTMPVASFVRELKRDSSKWIKRRSAAHAHFYWQNGYGVFSVGYRHVDTVQAYIARQEQHHSRATYKNEFRGLCRKHGLELDERYAWE